MSGLKPLVFCHWDPSGLPLDHLPKEDGLPIHSSLLSTYCVPGTIPGPEDTVVNLTEALCR